jgi:hypothetical protein
MLARSLGPLGFVLLIAGAAGPDAGDSWKTGSPGGDPVPVRHLILSSPLLKKLSTLADGLHREVILCLTGETREGEMVAKDFVMPDPARSAAHGASAEKCPAGSVALWHNHPLVRMGPRGLGEGVRVARPNDAPGARGLCALSYTDLQAGRSDQLPFMVVSVDAETWCWWSLQQVEEALDSGRMILSSLSGQRSWH